jgi:membrane-associated protein
MLAGTGRMPPRKFAAANVTGAAIWAVGISLLGFWLGKSINIDKYIYPIVAVIIVVSLIPPFLEWRRAKKRAPVQFTEAQAEAEAAALHEIVEED